MYVGRWEIIILRIKYSYLDYGYSQGEGQGGGLASPSRILNFKICFPPIICYAVKLVTHRAVADFCLHPRLIYTTS